MQSKSAQSVRCDCNITDTYSWDGKTLDKNRGKLINYDCSANSPKDISDSNIVLNTDFPLYLTYKSNNIETVDFSSVNLNGNAYNEATNIQEQNEYFSNVKTVDLTHTSASVDLGYTNLGCDNCADFNPTSPQDPQKLVFIGTIELNPSDSVELFWRRLEVSNNSNIKMTLNPNSNNLNTTQNFDCILNEISKPEYKLSCNLLNGTIDTNAQTLHLSTGRVEDGTIFLINMLNPEDTVPIVTGSQKGNKKYYYSKSSGGLSGGAIAGIVVAIIVALGTTAGLFFFFRKPTTNMQNNSSIVSLNALKK